MVDWITHFAVMHNVLVYGVIAVLAFLEGHILTIVCGFLARLGYLNPFLSALAVASGNLVGDIMWYQIGAHHGERFVGRWGKYVGITPRSLELVKGFFHKHKESIILGSKLTNGFGLAVVVLFTAGMTKIPFRRYMALNIIGELMWTGSLTLVGYAFGQFYLAIDNVMWKVGIVVLAILAIYAATRIYKHYKNNILKQQE